MKKILLVEDDQGMRQLYQSVLSRAGFKVVLAENGKLGVEAAKSEKPDLILMDIMMPEMNGVEALKMIKSDKQLSKTPVIMLTNVASGSLETAKETLNLGALSYIIKSDTEPKKLVELVNKTINLKG